MGRPQLRAEFFVTTAGVVYAREPELKRSVKMKIYKRDKGICQGCGVKVKFGGNEVSPFMKVASGHIDHIFPRARGGRNDGSNLRLLCMTCNSAKGAN